MLFSRVTDVVSRVLVTIAAFALTLLVVTVAAPANAHSVLLGTDPDDGEQLAAAPDEVSLTFNEDITDLGTQVVITAGDGETVSEGDIQINGPVITQALTGTRPEGAYTVTWRAVSADGHPISGEFTFTAAEAVGATSGSEQSPEGAPAEGDEAAQDAQELADQPEQPADEAEVPVEDGGLSASTWVIIGVLIVAAVILVTVLARSLGAPKRKE